MKVLVIFVGLAVVGAVSNCATTAMHFYGLQGHSILNPPSE